VPVSGEPADLRILHWNVHSWRDADGTPNPGAVADLISEAAPDVVSLVEVNEPLGAPEALADLAEKCGYSWIFVPSIELGSAPAARGYGNALLTRLPVAAVQHVDVYSPERRYDGTEPTETRSATLARVRFAGAYAWVGTTHLPATEHGSRETAARVLHRLAGQLATPWIICGDFNAPFATLFGDGGGIRVHPQTPAATFPARRPVTAIDYAISPPEIATNTKVLRLPGSDHLPLLAIARLA
jgi:endonuclease/exonuclease/phosphatase family metal-dependent hydrolase